jgi:hypothetical protein
LRRTGREGLHARVVEGERRRLEHSRAARKADERREMEADGAEPGELTDMREALVSDLCGPFDPSTWFAWKRAAEARSAPQKRSRKSLQSSAKNAAGKLNAFAGSRRPADTLDELDG